MADRALDNSVRFSEREAFRHRGTGRDDVEIWKKVEMVGNRVEF